MRLRRPAVALVGGLLAAALALAPTAPLAAGPVAAAAAEPSAPVRARPADSLVEAYGVGVHLQWLDTPYRETDRVLDALEDLGVRHVRDVLHDESPRQYAAIREAAARGISTNLVAQDPRGAWTPEQSVATISRELVGAVESIEGPNEWDISGRPDWASELRAYQTRLHAAVESNPRLADLPVLAPALAFTWNLPAVGSLAEVSDLANGHFYAGGRVPSAPLDSGIAALRSMTGDKPTVITEAGYHNALAADDGHLATPEDVAAAYLPRLLLDSYARGVRRVYSYELLDAFDDPTRTNVEAHFGLLRHDLTAKPAYTAMKSVLALVDDPGAPFTPGSLSYRVDGGGDDLRQLLLQRRDGRFVLFLWRDVSLWDPVAQRRLAVRTQDVTVRLASGARVRVDVPTRGPAPTWSGTAQQVPLQLGAEVVALTIAPGTAAAAPSRARAAAAAPAPVVLTKVTPRERAVVVRWRAASYGVAARSFQVRVGQRAVTVPGYARRAVVTGLRARTAVRATVRAGNETGWSRPTVSRVVRPRR